MAAYGGIGRYAACDYRLRSKLARAEGNIRASNSRSNLRTLKLSAPSDSLLSATETKCNVSDIDTKYLAPPTTGLRSFRHSFATVRINARREQIYRKLHSLCG